MENKTTILNELKELSPTLAGISRVMPYTVPEGYFDALAGHVQLKINEDSAAGPSLDNLGKAPVYEVPEGYFDGLAANILKRVKASAAATPAEELSLLSPVLGRMQKKSPFSTPEGYFGELTENVVSGVRAIAFVNQELENLSPLMNSLRGAAVYSVPEGYFDTLPAAVLNKVQRHPAKVVSMSFRKKVIRFAAAAVMAGVIVLGGYLGLRHSDTPNAEFTRQVAKVSDQDLENFLSNNTVALADAGTIVTNDSINENDAKDLLANVSDDELQKYLEEHGMTSNPVTN